MGYYLFRGINDIHSNRDFHHYVHVQHLNEVRVFSNKTDLGFDENNGHVICRFLDAYRDTDAVYTKPWTRISSYQSGMILGFILYVTRDRRIYLTRRQTVIIWSAILGFFTYTVVMHPDQPKILIYLFMSSGRIVYGLIVGGIIVICQWGYGRWFEWISTRRFIWQFSKLSYTIYLIHPAIGMIVYGTDAHVLNISFIKTVSISYNRK